MRAREFLFEYDRKKTAQTISGGEKAEKAVISDRGNMGPLDQVRSSLISLQMDRPVTIPGAQPAFTPPSDYRKKPGPLIKDPTVRERFLEDLLSVIETKDPTTNKQYTPWLVRMYINGGVKLEDLNRGNILGIYDIGKRRRMIKSEHSDINVFKSYADFEGTMRVGYDLDSIDNTEKKVQEKGQASKVFENGDVLVVVPHDEAAACRYGAQTHWCTAATRGQNYFDQYNRQGKMYILIPKKPKHDKEKYQLHFPSGQFMNEYDEEISPYFLLTERFPELIEFFYKVEPKIKDLIVMCPDEVLQTYIDQIAEIAQDHMWEIISDWEQNDDYYYNEMQKLYGDDGGEIDWDKVHNAGDDYIRWSDEARRFSIDMQEEIRPKAETIKSLMQFYGPPLDPTYNLEYLPDAIAVNVKNRFPLKRESDHGMVNFIDNDIGMKKDGDAWAAYKKVFIRPSYRG
jgi:hypothetical protein